MTVRPRATEIPELVRRLGSRRPSVVNAARARLCASGARAVEKLVEALDEGTPRIRANAMPLLALIQDPRAREPLMTMLLDRDARMRDIAARCLARFPCGESAGALGRFLKKEKQIDIRVAAVHSLLQLYAAGQEQAICPLLTILLDGAEDARLRVAALELLPLLRPTPRRAIAKRLRQDPSQPVARKTIELEQAAGAQRSSKAPALRSLLAQLGSDEFPVWNRALHRLADCGAASVQPLTREMRRRAHDPEYCIRAGMVIKALGPRHGPALAEALDRIEEPLPLQVLVEVVGALGEKPLIYRLKELIDRVASRTAPGARLHGFDPMERVRAKAHLELARVGSRLAIEDLREALRNRNRRLEAGFLSAAELIGTRDELPDLLRAYGREDRFARARIVAAIRAIMRRERIRRNDKMFKDMGEELGRAFSAVTGRPPSARSRPGRSIRRS